MSSFLDQVFPEDLQGSYQQVENPLPPAPELPAPVSIPGPGEGTQRHDNIDKLFDDFINRPASPDASLQPYKFNYEESDASRYMQSDYFKTMGYHPEKDNETIYGNRQTFGDTMQQAFGGQMALAWGSFVDGWAGWGRLTKALIHGDAKRIMGTPEELEELHKQQTEVFNKYAIYRTPESEESIFNRQFLGDLIQQSGFALGTIGQFVSEELLTMGLTAAFKPLTGARAILGAVDAAVAIGEGTKDMKKVGDVWKFTNMMRQMYEGMKSAGTTLRNVARLTPIGGDLIKAARQGANGWELIGAGFNSFRRTVAEANMSLTEARMEAAGTFGELSENLRTQTLQNKGVISPEDEQKISELAGKAAWDNFRTNSVLIAAMNRLQLDNLFRSFGSDKRILKQMLEEGSLAAPKTSLASAVTGTAARDVADQAGKIGIKKGEQLTRAYEKGFFGTFGNLGEIARDFGGKTAAWEATKSTFRNTFKWEVSEGIQEMLQDVSNDSFKKYYSELYNGNHKASLKEAVASSVEDELSSMQGWKTFLMGAVTGRLISPINFAVGKGSELLGTTSEERKATKTSRREAITALNGFFANPNQFAPEWIANTNVQNLTAKKMEWALNNKDKYVYEHAKDSAFAKVVAAAKKLNMVDSLTDTIREFGKHFNDQEATEAFARVNSSAENKQKFSEYMNNVADQVDGFSRRYDKLFEEFGDLIQPERYEEATQPQLKLARRALHEAIEWMASSEYRAGRAAKRAMDIMDEAARIPGVGQQSYLAFRILADDKAIANEIDLLKHEIETDKQSTSITNEIKERITEKEKQLQSLYTFAVNKEFFSSDAAANQKAADDMMSALANYFISKNKEGGLTTTFTQKDIGDLFFKLNDYRKLKRDEKDFMDAYALMAKPKKFLAIYARIHGALNALKIQKMEEAAKASQDANKNNTQNKANSNNNPANPNNPPPGNPSNPNQPNNSPGPGNSPANINTPVNPASPNDPNTPQTPASPVNAGTVTATQQPKKANNGNNSEEDETEEDETGESSGSNGGGPKGPKGSPGAPGNTNTNYKTGDFVYHKGKNIHYYVNGVSGDRVQLVNLDDGRLLTISAGKMNDRMGKGVLQKADPDSVFGDNLGKDMKIMPQSRGGLFIVRNSEDGTYLVLDKHLNLVTEDELSSSEPFQRIEDAIDFMKEVLQRKIRKEKEKTFEFDGVQLREGDILLDKNLKQHKVVSKKPVMVNGEPTIVLKRLDTDREFQVSSLQPFHFPSKAVVRKNANDKRFRMSDPQEPVKVYAHVRTRQKANQRQLTAAEQKAFRNTTEKLKQEIRDHLSGILRTVPREKIAQGLTMKISRNSNLSTRKAKEGEEDQNDNLSLHGEPISVELFYDGKSIGFLPYYNRYQYYDTKTKKTVAAPALTLQQFSQIFDISKGQAERLLHEFKEAHRSGEAVHQLLEQELGKAGTSTLTLSGNQVKDLFDVVVSPGQYDWANEPTVKLRDFEHNHIQGNTVVLVKSRQYNKDHYEEEVSPVFEKEMPEDEKEKLLQKIEENRFPLGSKQDAIQNMSSYVAAVELPNGQVRFLDLEVPQVSEKDLASTVRKVNEQMEKAREQNQNEEEEMGVDDMGFNDSFNNKVLGKIFIATRNKNKGTYLNLRLNAAGDLVLFFEDRKRRTKGDILVKANETGSEPFNGVDDFIQQINAAIEEYDAEQPSANKIGITLEPKNFKQHVDRNAGFEQLGDLLVKVSSQVVKGQSLSVKTKDFVARPFEVQPSVTESKTIQEAAQKKSSSGVEKRTSFKTAKGSTYEVREDGSTVRNKAFRPEHGEAEQGIQPKSEKTFYLTKDQLHKLDLVQTQGWKEGERPVIAELANGDLAVGILGGQRHGKFVERTRVTPKTKPVVGLFPLEIWDGGRQHHFGNEITEVNNSLVKTAQENTSPTEQSDSNEGSVEETQAPSVDVRTDADELKELVQEQTTKITQQELTAKFGLLNFILGLSNKLGLAGWTGSKQDIQNLLAIDVEQSSLKEIKEAAQKIYDQLTAQRNPISSPEIEAKKADIERRRKEKYDQLVDDRSNIYWDSIVFDETVEGKKRKINGVSTVIDYAGRKIVIINVNGRNIPFYLSTGHGGKTDVTSGKWYPIFGISSDGWLNKLSGKEINNYYGSKVLKGIAEALDSKIGDIRNDQTIPKVGSKGSHIEAINKDVTPTDNGLPTTAKTIHKNIKDTVDFLEKAINAKYDAELAALEKSTSTPHHKEAINNFVNRMTKGESMNSPEDLQFYDNFKKEIEKELLGRVTKEQESVTTGHQQALSNFVDRIVKGEQMVSKEDLQFYDNYKKEIEKELLARQAKEAEATATTFNTQTATTSGANTGADPTPATINAVLGSPVDLKGGEKPVWMMDSDEVWQKTKEKGTEIIISGKNGKDRKVKVKEKQSGKSPYLSYEGAAYKSFNDEWKFIWIPRAIQQGKYQQAIAEGRMTASDAITIIQNAGLDVPKDILQLVQPGQSASSAQTATTPSLQKLDGARDNQATDTRTFLQQLNIRPQQLVGWEEIENGQQVKGITNGGKAAMEDLGAGAQFTFFNSDTKTQTKYFVRGHAEKMITAVEKHLKTIPFEPSEKTASSPAKEEKPAEAPKEPITPVPNREEQWKSLEAIPYEQRTDEQHADFIKGKFIQTFTGKGLPLQQVEAAVALMEARAAVASPENPAAWFRAIQDIGQGEFQDQTPRLYQLPNGQSAMGMPSSPEVIEGFYSPIEKKLLNTKANNLSSTKWKELFGKGDEARFTGLLDFLNAKKPNEQVTKQQIYDFLKSNRIQIIELVKSENYQRIPITKEEAKGSTYRTYALFDSQGKQLTSNQDIDAADQVFAQPTEVSQPTRYATYQMSGEKESYKEVLIALPRKNLAKPKDARYAQLKKEQDRLVQLFDEYDEKSFSRNQNESVQATRQREEIGDKLNDIQAELNDYEQEKIEDTKFQSTHWQEPNVLVHLRMNTRRDAEGRKLLFIEELQSDWGQRGKKLGFQEPTELDNLKAQLVEAEKEYDRLDFNKLKLSEIWTTQEAQRVEHLKEAIQKLEAGISRAPFITDTNTWAKLGLKIALKYAVKEGAESIAWTSGNQQNERYDLSKQLERISWWKVGEDDNAYGITAFEKNDRIVLKQSGLSLENIEQLVGKEVAQKIKDGTGATNKLGQTQFGELEGNDLRLQGKGMKGFYGEPSDGNEGILGKLAKAVVKELTGKDGHLHQIDVQQNPTASIEILRTTEDIKRVSKTGNYTFLEKGQPITKNRAYELVEAGEQVKAQQKSGDLQHAITITPELKSAVEQGQPLFQKNGSKAKGALETLSNGRKIIHALHAPDFSTAIHEIAHVFEDELSDSDKRTIQHWAGTGEKWTTKTSETFARGFERYLRDGQGPVPSLKTLFEKAKKWLEKIYRRLIGSPIEKRISPEVRQVFDGLFQVKTAQELAQKTAAPSTPQQQASPTGSHEESQQNTPAPEKKPERPQPSPKVVSHLINENKDLRKTLASVKAAVFRELSKGKGKKNPLKLLEAVEKDARVVAIKQKLTETNSSLSALKVATAAELRTADIVHIKRFKKWVENKLPAGLIQLKENQQQLDDLTDNMLKQGVKVGQFVADLAVLNGVEQPVGTIEVGTDLPFKYHEAFHAVFRLLLSEDQVQLYLALAKKELAQELAKENKTIQDRLTELYQSNPGYYDQLGEKGLEERLYEEYLADRFDAWKMERKISISNIIKQFFRLLRQLADFITRQSSRSEIEALFYEINAGKYKNAAVADNRFTQQLRQTRQKQEVHKDIRFTEGEWIQDEEGRPLKIDVHLPSSKGAALIASLTANLLRHLDKQQEQDLPTILNDLLDEYAKLYDKHNDHYLQWLQEEESIDKYFLTEPELDNLHDLFTNGRQQLVDAVKERFDSMDLKYQWQQEQKIALVKEKGPQALTNRRDKDASGGFDTMPKELLRYLSAIAVPAVDDFGNKYLQNGEALLEAVDVRMLYSGLQKATANSPTVHDMLLNLREFGQFNEQCRRFYQQFSQDLGLQLTDQGYELIKAGNEYLLRMVATEFQRHSINVLSLRKDVSEFTSRLLNPIEWEASPEQFYTWYNAYTSIYEAPLLSKSKEEKEKLADQAANGLNYFSIFAVDEPITDTELQNISLDSSNEIKESLGIDFHPQYLAYSLAHARSQENRTAYQQQLVDSHKSVKPFTAEQAHTLTLDIYQYRNPFLVHKDSTEVTEELTDELETEATPSSSAKHSFLFQLAYANSFFDEQQRSETYNNEIGEARVTRQHPDVFMQKIQEIIQVFKDNKEPGLPEQWKNDPFFQNHFLLSSPQFKHMAASLRLALVSGMKIPESKLVWDRDPITGKTYRRVEDGITYNDYTDRDFIFSLIDPYFFNTEYVLPNPKKAAKETKKSGSTTANQTNNGNTQSVSNEPGHSFVTARHVLRVPGQSEKLYTINLPVIKAVEVYRTKTRLTQTAAKAFLEEIKREYQRIQRVKKEIDQIEKEEKAALADKNFKRTIDKVEGYHTPAANGEIAGLTLSKTGHLLGDLAPRLQQAALRKENFSQFENEIEKKLNHYWFHPQEGVLQKFAETLLNMGVIKKGDEDNGKYINKMLPYFIYKGFAGPKGTFNYRRDALLNLTEGDVELNLAQILVNDFLNTQAINQLLFGDPAKSFSSLSQMSQAAETATLNGPSAAFDLPAPALGVRHAGLKSHVVHVQPGAIQLASQEATDTPDQINPQATTWADQTWITVKSLRHLLFGLGKLTPYMAKQLDQLDNGASITAEEMEKPGGLGQYLNGNQGVQLVYDDGQRRIELSGQLLTKASTSSQNDGKWQALPQMEELHALRQKLERFESKNNSFAIVVPVSASSGQKANVATSVSTLTDWNFQQLDNRFWRLVDKPVPAPPSMDSNEHSSSAAIARQQYEQLRKELFQIQGDSSNIQQALQEGRVQLNLGVFQKQAAALLESAGADSQLLDFFSLDEKGQPRYNLNGPLTIEKFTELFFNYLDQQLSQPGILANSGSSLSQNGASAEPSGQSNNQAATKALNQLKQNFPLLKNKIEKGPDDLDVATGKLAAFRTQKEVGKIIAPSKDWSLPFSILHSFGIKLRQQNSEGKKIEALQINGVDFNSYEHAQMLNPETGNFDGARKEGVLTELTTLLNDKDLALADKLGLQADSVQILGHMVALGVPVYWAFLLLQQPAVQEYYQQVKQQSSPVKTGDETKEGVHTIGTDLLLHWKRKAGAKKPQPLTVDLLQSNLTMRGMDAEQQYSVLAAFLNFQEQTEHYSVLQQLLKTVGTVNRSSFEAVQQYADKLQLFKQDKEFNKSMAPFDLRQVLTGQNQQQEHHPLTAAYLQIHQELQSLLSAVLIPQTPLVSELQHTVLANLHLEEHEKPAFLRQFNLDVSSVLGILAYQKQLRDNDQTVRLASLSNGLIYSEIAEDKPKGFLNSVEILNAIRQKLPDNYFVNRFLHGITAHIITDDGVVKYNPYNDDGISKVEINTWAKLHRFNVEKLQDGFLEIFQNPETNYLAWALFHYLLVKDGGQLSNGSFIQFVPNFMFKDLLDATGKVNQLLARKASDADFVQLFGMNRQQLLNLLATSYISHPLNEAHIPERIINKPANLLHYSKISVEQEILDYNPDTYAAGKNIEFIELNFWGGLNKKGGLTNKEKSTLEAEGFDFVDKSRNKLTIPQLKFLKNIQSLTKRGFALHLPNEASNNTGSVEVEFPFLIKNEFEVNKRKMTVFYQLESVNGKKIQQKDGHAIVNEAATTVRGGSARYVEVTLPGSAGQWRFGSAIDEVPQELGSVVREPVPVNNNPGFSLDGYRKALRTTPGKNQQTPVKDLAPLLQRFEKKYGVEVHLISGEAIQFLKKGKRLSDQSRMNQLLSEFLEKNGTSADAINTQANQTRPAADRFKKLNILTLSLPAGKVNIHGGNEPFQEAIKRVEVAMKAAKENPDYMRVLQKSKEKLESMMCKK